MFHPVLLQSVLFYRAAPAPLSGSRQEAVFPGTGTRCKKGMKSPKIPEDYPSA
jgi:hypothetical protein